MQHFHGYGLIIASVPTVFGGYLNIAGVNGSPVLLPSLVLAGFVVALLVAFFSILLKWWLLFEALKSYIKKYFLRRLTEKETLLGIGPSGAISVGVVAKAIRVLGCEPPSVVVVDHRYISKGTDPSVGTLVSPNLNLQKNRAG